MDFKMDIFNEQLVKVKKTPLNILSIVLLFVAAVLLALTAILLIPVEFGTATILVIIGLCVGVWYLLRFFDIEYEYSLTNGVLDIDKIYARSIRKSYLTLNMRNMEEMAPISESGAKEKVYAFPQKKVFNCSSNADPFHTYYAIFDTKNQGKICLLFEPNDKMIEGLKHYTGNRLRLAKEN